MSKLDKNIENLFIVCAAVLFSRKSCIGDCETLSDLLIIGVHHGDSLMRRQVSKESWSSSNPVQTIREKERGFIDQYGNFHNRKDAFKIAKHNNQIKFHFDESSDELFSEMLY